MRTISMLMFVSVLVMAQEKPVPASPEQSVPAAAVSSSSEAVSPKPCLIVKHKGTVGRRLLWTALIGVPIAPGSKYDYVDSVNHTSKKMSYKGKELEQLQTTGVHVVVLDNKYKVEDLDSARRRCQQPATPVATK